MEIDIELIRFSESMDFVAEMFGIVGDLRFDTRGDRRGDVERLPDRVNRFAD